MEGEGDGAAAPVPPEEARDVGDGGVGLPAEEIGAGAQRGAGVDVDDGGSVGPPGTDQGAGAGAGEAIPEQAAEDDTSALKKKKKKRVGGIMFAEVIVVEQVTQPPSLPPHIPRPSTYDRANGECPLTCHIPRPREYDHASGEHPPSSPTCRPGGNPGGNLKSISPRCYLFEVAFVWELTKETIVLPLGCLQGGVRRSRPPLRYRSSPLPPPPFSSPPPPPKRFAPGHLAPSSKAPRPHPPAAHPAHWARCFIQPRALLRDLSTRHCPVSSL